MKELRNEVGRLRSDFEQKWSSQIKMVSVSKRDPFSPFVSSQVDANNRSVFKMHDKMVMLTDWLRSLGTSTVDWMFDVLFFFPDKMLSTNILQSGLDSDSMDQLQNKLKRYATAIEALRGKGIGQFVLNTRRRSTFRCVMSLRHG